MLIIIELKIPILQTDCCVPWLRWKVFNGLLMMAKCNLMKRYQWHQVMNCSTLSEVWVSSTLLKAVLSLKRRFFQQLFSKGRKKSKANETFRQLCIVFKLQKKIILEFSNFVISFLTRLHSDSNGVRAMQLKLYNQFFFLFNFHFLNFHTTLYELKKYWRSWRSPK